MVRDTANMCDICGGESEHYISKNVSLCSTCRNTIRGEEIERQRDLYQLIEDVDSKHLITKLLTHLLATQDIYLNEYVAADSAGLPPKFISHAIGLAWSFPKTDGRNIKYEEISDELLNLYYWYLDDSHNNGSTIERDLQSRDLVSGRFAHGLQERWIATTAYREFDTYLEEEVGFTARMSVSLTDNIVEMLEGRVKTVMNEFNEQMSAKGVLPTQSHYVNRDLLREPITNAIDEVYSTAKKQLWIEGELLYQQIPNDQWDVFMAVLDRLSAEIGESNVGIAVGPEVNDYTRPYRCPYDVNPTEKYLFAVNQANYLVPDPTSWFYTLSHTFYYDVLSSSITEGEFRGRWGLI